MKTTLRSINSTLLTVTENEKCLYKGMEETAKHVNAQDGEIKEMFTAYLLLLTINEHAMQLKRPIDECRREYEVLIDAVIDSQRGVIQPQLITPAQILEQVKHSQADMRSDLSLPILTSATYQHLILKIVTFDVFLKGKFLVYVIRLPLTSNVIFNLYHILPFPIKVRGINSKFIFIQPEHDSLLMDTAKRYFTGLKLQKSKHTIYIAEGNPQG